MPVIAFRPAPAATCMRVDGRGRASLDGLREQELMPGAARGGNGHDQAPRRAGGGAHEPGRRKQQERDKNPQHRPGKHAVMKGCQQGGEHRGLHQERLGQLPQRQHEGPHPRVVLDLHRRPSEKAERHSGAALQQTSFVPESTGPSACASWRRREGRSTARAASARSPVSRKQTGRSGETGRACPGWRSQR